jgi:DNA polymerase-3 subunit delta'
VFRRVAAGTHADLLTVEREYDEKRKRLRSEIVVDDVRRVADFLRLTPAEEGWRVVVVDGAEALNRNAANALLKVLEEPPARALLLLVCAAPGRLLPTIRSRCRRLRLAALGEADMGRLLAAYLPDLAEDERRRLAALAEGAPGRALALAEEQGLQIAAKVDAVLAALPSCGLLDAYALSDELARSDGAFGTFMDLLRAAISRAVRATVRGEADAKERRLAGLRPLDAWGDVWQALTRLQDETERFNLDKRQAIVSGIALLNGQ